jgi:pimeloyl-ACP methyl ester carboxylesterase
MRTFLLIALLPWLIFFAFADGSSTGLLFGSFGGLIFLFIFGFSALRKFFSLAWITLIFLIIMSAITFVWPKSILVHYSLPIATLILTIFSFVTIILYRPFTLPYAKIQAPKVYWKHPLFLRVNYWITAVWGLVFLFYTIMVVLFNFGIGTKLWMMEISPTAALIFAIGFMIIFPDAYKTKFEKKGMVAAIQGISNVQMVVLGNITIGYRVLGKGPLLILAHGSRTNMHSWDPDLLRRLSEHFQLLIFDYPGIGYSTYQQMPFSATTIADCLYGMIDQLKLKPIAMIGYSFGGLIAQKLAVKYPKLLKALILINTSCGGHKATWCDEATRQKLMRTSATEASGEERFKQMMSVMFPQEILPRFIERVKKIMISAAVEGLVSQEMQQKQRQVVDHFQQNDQLANQIAKLKIPVLIIVGKQDVIVPFANAELLKSKLPQAKLLTYDDAGHGVVYQYPIDIADNIKEFLASL